MFWYALYHTVGYMLAFAVIGYTIAWFIMKIEAVLDRESVYQWAEKKAREWGLYDVGTENIISYRGSRVCGGTIGSSSNDGRRGPVDGNQVVQREGPGRAC